MTETDKKTADDGYVLSADWSDKPSEAVHVEMSVKEVGELQTAYPIEGAAKIVDLSPECAGPVGGPVSGAFEINRVFYEGPPELLAELDRIMEEKEKEQEELVHDMLVAADEWGRKEVGRVRSEGNNKVRTFISLENDRVQGARQACKADKKLVKEISKKAMRDIQERLNKELKSIDVIAEETITSIRSEYRSLYNRSEVEMKKRTDEVLAKVADFAEVIQELSLERLQELKQSGVLRVTSDIIVVPGEEGEDAV